MRRVFAIAIAVALAACGNDPTARPVEELRDPNTCKECHEQHFTQWSGSMHAYASDDPVFLAMNKRGQRETNGELGDFCLKCHAPMAVELGLVSDPASFDPEALPAEARGITCYFCHNVTDVLDDHNNPLVLANDQTMRGGIKDPVESPAHFSAYSELMDSAKNNSEMCGSCHDIVVPGSLNGAADLRLERTFEEWQQTFFANSADPLLGFTCGDCHMISKRDLVADAPGLETRPRDNGFHEHMWPGIDTALTPFPEMEAQLAAIQRDLDPAVTVVGPFNSITKSQHGGICLDPDSTIRIRVDNLGNGHAWPSGAAQDRRAWLEVKAFDADGQIVFESGVTPAGTDPVDSPGTLNPQTFGLWDRTFKADNTKAHFFWDVARVESQLLKLPAEVGGDHSTTVEFQVANAALIERIETRIFIRALPYELIDELVASGDLDAAIRDRLPTLEVGGGRSVWTRATQGTGTAVNTRCNPRPNPL